jgi:hypothetical protein
MDFGVAMRNAGAGFNTVKVSKLSNDSVSCARSLCCLGRSHGRDFLSHSIHRKDACLLVRFLRLSCRNSFKRSLSYIGPFCNHFRSSFARGIRLLIVLQFELSKLRSFKLCAAWPESLRAVSNSRASSLRARDGKYGRARRRAIRTPSQASRPTQSTLGAIILAWDMLHRRRRWCAAGMGVVRG